jgi:MFS transporter, YNFM family, putative membrane transport protein
VRADKTGNTGEPAMSFDRRRGAVMLVGLVTFINLYATQPLLPLLRQELHVGARGISLTVSATTFAIALIAPFAGAVGDVLGRKRVIGVAMMALVVPTALIAFAHGLGSLVLWRFVQGLLLPPVFAVTVAYIGEELPADEATAMTGIYLSAGSVGSFLGRFLTGVLADSIGWRGAFVVLAAITLVAALGVAVLLPRERKLEHDVRFGVAARQMIGHLRNPALLATFAVGFGVLFVFVATFTYVSFHLASAPYHLSPSGLGALFATYLTGMVTSLLTARGIARFGRSGFVLAVILLWAAGTLVTLLPSLAAVVVGLALGAACGFVCQTAATSFVAVTAHAGRSSAVGLYVTCYYVGGSVGGVLPGLIWERWEWPGTVAIVLIVLALMGLLVARFWRQALPSSRSASTLWR